MNDQRLCLAGIGEHGHLSQYLCWNSISPDDRASYQEGHGADLALLVTGHSPDGELSRWVERELHVGDEIRVRILEADAPDKAKRTTVHEQQQSARETRRQLYEALKREFESDGTAA